MEIKIYTPAGVVRHTTDTTRKESTRSQQLMGDNIVQIVFDHTEELHFKAGDNITYKGAKFTLVQDYKAEVRNEWAYHYELKFEGVEGLLKTLPFFHYVTDGDRVEKEPEVNYTATLPVVAEMAVASLRQVSGDDTWRVGELAANEESKYLNFSADSVFGAFGKIADEFRTEWWLDGKAVNFCRCERGDLQTFSAKAGGGLSGVEIAAVNEVIPNRIYAYGSERNITKKYTGQGLAYNTRLRLPAGVEYVDVSGGAENIVSRTVFFDNDEVGNVYPRRVGTITNVVPGGMAEAPIYYFYDEDIDFDPNVQWIDGTMMMVHFESGMLKGRDFETEYDKKLKRFRIFSTQDGEMQIPFGSIVPTAGDKYVLWNMEMPQSYITNAEQELQNVAQEYVDNLNRKVPEITCRSFEPYFDQHGKVITIGSKVRIEDDRLKGGYVQSRVSKYSYPLYCESQVEFTLSENVSAGRISQIENKLEDVTTDNAKNVQATRAVSRRAWRDTQELTTALEALRAELVLVGNPESQFSCSCVFKSNRDNDPNLLAISAGELQHAVYKGEAGDKWAVEGAEFTLAEDTLYYIYFKCGRSTDRGNVIISQTRLGVESQEGFYLFLGGVVSSIFENARIVNVVSGFTQIAGGNITSERIQDPTGKLIIDLTSNPPTITARNGAKFIGSFSFEAADGLDNIAGIDAIKTDISDLAQDKDNIAKGLGYTDYQAMVEAKGAGQTIIKDGFVRTDIIKADELFVRNLRTSAKKEDGNLEDGARVEIVGDMRSIKIYDSDNNERTVFTGAEAADFIPADMIAEYAQISTGRSSFSDVNVILHAYEYFSDERDDIKVLCEFVLSGESIIQIPPIYWDASASIMSKDPTTLLSLTHRTFIDVIQKNTDGSRTRIARLLSSFIGDNRTEKGNTEATELTGMFPGTYTIELIAEQSVSAENAREKASSFTYLSASQTTTTGNIEIIKRSSPSTTIYSNGISSFWGSNRYFGVLQLSNKDFIRAIDGNYGFKLNGQDGFLVSQNVGSESSHWNMPIGCVLMGTVTVTGGIAVLKYRSCDPTRLKCSVKRPSSGFFDFKLLTPAEMPSTYFSNPQEYCILGCTHDPTNNGDICLEGGRTASTFRIRTISASGTTTQDRYFFFYIIDLRNLPL